MTDVTQALVDQAYERWQKNNWSLADFWKQLTLKEKVAVFSSNLAYQVCNGGFFQWHDNGYSAAGPELVQFLPKLGPVGQQVARLIADVLAEIDREGPGYYETFIEEAQDEDTGEWYKETWQEWVYPELDFGQYDDAFYEIDDAFLAELEAFLPEPGFDERMTAQVDPVKTSLKPVMHGPMCGNIFAIMGACQNALKKANQRDKAKELSERVMGASSYDQALQICMEYVEFRL